MIMAKGGGFFMNLEYKQLLLNINKSDRFYIENFLKIRTKAGDLVKFKLNPMQIKSEKLIEKHQTSKGKPTRVIWLKARQHGISTYAEAKVFKRTATRPNRNTLIVAHEDKATQNLFGMSKLYFEELPEILRPMKKYSNETALTFENSTNDDNEKAKNPGLRSKITVATAKNVDTGRSATIHSLHASEVAFWDNAEKLMTGLLQCVPDDPSSEIYIESTANGVGGWFYNFWKKSERGETDYLPIFLAWFENPDYTKKFESKQERNEFIRTIEAVLFDSHGNIVKTEEQILREQFDLSWEQLHWRHWCIANKLHGDLELFHQEYPSTPDEAFIASGRPRFAIGVVKEYKAHAYEPKKIGYLNYREKKLIFDDEQKGYIRIWKEPEPDMFYCIGADVAEGLIDGDYSCAVVLDQQLNVCASWHGHIEPDLFGDELVKMAKLYNEAYIGVENNKDGLSVLKAIQRKEYWNIYYTKNYDKISDQITQKMGWTTTSKSKPLMINQLAEYIRNKWLGVWWIEMITEMLTYVICDDGSTNAQSGAHDDTIMALGIALMLVVEGRGDGYTPEDSEALEKSNIIVPFSP